MPVKRSQSAIAQLVVEGEHANAFYESSEAAVALMCSTNVSDTNVGIQLRVKCVTAKEASCKTRATVYTALEVAQYDRFVMTVLTKSADMLAVCTIKSWSEICAKENFLTCCV